MKRTIRLLLGLMLTTPLMGQPTETAEVEKVRSPEALEILERVDKAVKAVHSVRYQASTEPSGIAENFASAANGTAVMVGWTGSLPQKFYSHVKTKKQGTDEKLELTGGGNGDTYFLIDHLEKKAYEDMDPAVMGSGARALRGFGMIEFVHERPFDDELGADVVELQGEETVADHECYKIRVVYAGGRGESIWFFSKSDYLPRRRIRTFSVPEQGDGAIEINISRLEVNIEPDESLFRLELPEGYEQIDDFAP